MTTRPRKNAALILVVLLVTGVLPAAYASGDFLLESAFRYQGRLQHQGAPADGLFDLTFEVYDARSGGRLLGRIDRFDFQIRGGILEADLDFGSRAFAQGQPWLEIQVRPAGHGPYTALAPRQMLTGGSTCVVNEDVEINGDLTVGAGHDLVVGGPLTGLLVDDREISVSPLWIDRELLINPNGGNGQVGIGVSEAEAPLSLPGGPEVQASVGGALVIGPTSGLNLALDSNEISARNNGTLSPLYLNPGGNVGVGTGIAQAPLSLPGGPDVTPTSGGALLVGPTNASNIAIDANEIMARNNGATATLHLNPEGGNVQFGGPAVVGYEVVTQGGCGGNDSIVAVCSVGKRVLGGGCYGIVYYAHPNCANDDLCPGGNRGYRCTFDGCDSNSRAYAICATVR